MGRTRRVTMREAASILGISKDAVRKRIGRGTLRSDVGEDGRRYVYLDAGTVGEDAKDDLGPPEVTSDPRDALIQELRQEVEAWREEARRKDHLLAAALERIPQIEAPESPTTPAEASEGTEPRSSTEGQQEATERPETRVSWWRRYFGG